MKLNTLFPLFEMDWYEKSPLTAVLKRNRNKWIHFTKGAPNRDYRTATLLPQPEKPTDYYDRKKTKQYQRDVVAVNRKNATYEVPKLGVNPKSIWQDPRGTYFYRIDFLLSGFERMMSGNQFGLDYRYYFIVDINLNDPNGVDLGTMTWQDVEVIAKRNGWLEQMQAFRQATPEEQQEKLFSYARPNLPGSFFWHYIDRMVKDGKMSWNQAYRGISFIRDPNLAIIHSNEPDQCLVFDPKVIKIIESGENQKPIKAGSGADSIEQWMHALLSIIKQVRAEYGGDLTWMKKKPTLQFAKGVGKFILTIPERSDQMEVGINLNSTFGRAEDQWHIGYEALNKQSLEQVVQTISARVEQIAARKTDLLFTPIISIEAAKRLMMQQLGNNIGLSIRTTIYNSDNPRYNSVSMHGETERTIDGMNIKTTCFLHLDPAKMSASCNVWAGKQYLISASSHYNEEFNEPNAMITSIVEKTRENFDHMINYYAPSPDSKYYRPRFRTTEEVTAFQGWVVINCGLSLNGELRKAFAKEVAAFETYPDKRVLLNDIAYIMNSK